MELFANTPDGRLVLVGIKKHAMTLFLLVSTLVYACKSDHEGGDEKPEISFAWP